MGRVCLATVPSCGVCLGVLLQKSDEGNFHRSQFANRVEKKNANSSTDSNDGSNAQLEYDPPTMRLSSSSSANKNSNNNNNTLVDDDSTILLPNSPNTDNNTSAFDVGTSITG